MGGRVWDKSIVVSAVELCHVLILFWEATVHVSVSLEWLWLQRHVEQVVHKSEAVIQSLATPVCTFLGQYNDPKTALNGFFLAVRVCLRVCARVCVCMFLCMCLS